VCAASKKATVFIGSKYNDPGGKREASLSFQLTNEKNSAPYACPCNNVGTITFMPADDTAITDDDQAEWDMGSDGGPIVFDKLYFPITNKHWKQKLGWNSDDPPCNNKGGFYCMNLNDPRTVGFKIVNPSSPWGARGGKWVKKGSNNQNFTMQLTTGMSWTSTKSVTQTDQTTLSMAMQAGAKFFGVGASVTLTGTFSQTMANEVTASKKTTTADTCTASCSLPLPTGANGWEMWQWQLTGVKDSTTLSTETCIFMCIPYPNFNPPQCPTDCCVVNDKYCQNCNATACFKNATI
jgi:hypothetical protein